MRTLLIISTILLLFSCNKEEENELPILTEKHKSLVGASNAFGFNLYQEVASNESAEANIILSPLSVSTALGMLLNGAAGQTETSILNTLGLDLSTDENNASVRDLLDFLPNVDTQVQTSIANSIWYEESFNVIPEFIQVNQDNFDAEVSALDFSDPNSVNLINSWVSNATNDKIPLILESINSDERMFLINAVYLNAPWAEAFDPNNTFSGQFHLENGTSISTPMMHSEDIEFAYVLNSDVEMINLPYGNGAYSFTAILPAPGKTIQETEALLNPTNLKNWQSSLSTAHSLHLNFPKFELEFETSLKEALSALGMGIAFSDQADLSGINEEGGLLVTEVKHKCYIKLDEAGTEAAG
ncbi:MAG: serpin family protein, partial [Bacteroidetes bacterium]|nr:serpin family protein [Bacteroidota bacterium]